MIDYYDIHLHEHQEQVFTLKSLDADYPFRECLAEFISKGGKLVATEFDKDRKLSGNFSFKSNDTFYPVCAGGQCRSQTLFALLKALYPDNNVQPPHASRYGFDPYDDQMHHHQLYKVDDDTAYENVFGHPKSPPFGHAFISTLEEPYDPTVIKNYFDQNYFGPREQPRVYLTFSYTVHIILKRLIETNESLENVVVVAIPLEDEITKPPKDSGIQRGSEEAYRRFAEILLPLLVKPQVVDID